MTTARKIDRFIRRCKSCLTCFAPRYNVFVWDTPGHAASRPVSFDFDLMDKARWLNEILTVEGIEKPVLVGQSMGAYVAQTYCELFPERIGGFAARKFNIESKFGSVLDTVADISFAGACLIKLLPVFDIAVWLWLTVILFIKITNIIVGFIVCKTMVAEHTVMNKITGILLFLFPFVMLHIDFHIGAALLCAVATVAAIEEGLLIYRRRMK